MIVADLIAAILEGDSAEAVLQARLLADAGANAEQIIVAGIEAAMLRLDTKCTAEDFDLLEIMLSGRAVTEVMKFLYPDGAPREGAKGTVVIATPEGDVHDLGKGIFKMVLIGNGYRVVDCGKDCPLEKLIDTVEQERPLAVGISGLLTTIIPEVRKIKDLLASRGLQQVSGPRGGRGAETIVSRCAQRRLCGRLSLRRDPLSNRDGEGYRVNSLERIAAAVDFRKPDRAPVIAQVFGHAGALAGVPLDEYVRDGEKLARCQIEALIRYGYDAVFSVMDVGVETEAAGSTLCYRRNQYPVVDRHALQDGDTAALAVPDPERAGRMPEMLKALRILRDELGDEVLVVGCIVGPFTLTTQLLGIEKALFMAIDDFPSLERVMDYATEVAIRFGEAQLRAGAHLPMVFDPSASPAVIPPRLFREFELPRLRRVFEALGAAGATSNWLHIAGPVKPILPFYPQAGVGIANFDYCVTPSEARSQLPATCLDGNIRSLAFVDSTPAAIGASADDLLLAFGESGGFILSSGCEVPPESRPENVAAMIQAVGGGR